MVEHSTWAAFFCAMLLLGIILIVPGFLVLRALRFSQSDSLGASSALSVAVYTGLGIVFPFFGIAASLRTLVLPYALLALALFVASRCIERFRCKIVCTQQTDASLQGYLLPLIYLFFGLLATGIVLIKNLDGPDSFFQAYDNFCHLGLARSFLETGNFSSFNSLYPPSISTSPFLGGSSFYPSAWHVLVALVASSMGISVTASINVVNSVLVAFLFPLSAYSLFCKLFKKEFLLLTCGAVACVSVTSCPWDFIVFGPLYPNLLTIALVPGVISIFMELVEGLSVRSVLKSIQYAAVFVVLCIAVALAQPNGIFTMAVFLAPFLVDYVYRLACKSTGHLKKHPDFAALLCAMVIAAIWVGLFVSPPFSGVVSHNWPATVSVFQAIVDVLSLGIASAPVQPIMALSVLYGLVRIHKVSQKRWLVFPYLISAVSYILCVSTEGLPKHLLAGFWYSDPHRIAALMGFFGMPLAVEGLSALVVEASQRISVSWSSARFQMSEKTINGLLVLVIFVAAFVPSFEFNGVASIDTPFGYLRDSIKTQNEQNGWKILTAEEEAFSRKALDSVPEGSLIINSPNDGSAFLYGLCNANVLYRKFALPSLESEASSSVEIRFSLNNIQNDADVRSSVEEIGAQYVLLLDQGENEEEDRQWLWSYYPEQWEGIESIDDSTPGFTVVLSEGDMRLYKIDL